MVKKQTSLQKAYQKYYKQKLRKWNITTPTAIKDKNRRQKFYNELSEDWQKRRRKIRDPENLKTKYTNQYLRAVKRRFSIGKMKLEAGMVVEIRYVVKGENKKVHKYMVLILNPNYKKYLHCLRISEIKPVWFKRLVEQVGLESCEALPQCDRLNVQQLALDEKNSRRFYYKHLKKDMHRKYNDSYRTLIINNQMRAVSLYQFDFSKF